MNELIQRFDSCWLFSNDTLFIIDFIVSKDIWQVESCIIEENFMKLNYRLDNELVE